MEGPRRLLLGHRGWSMPELSLALVNPDGTALIEPLPWPACIPPAGSVLDFGGVEPRRALQCLGDDCRRHVVWPRETQGAVRRLADGSAD